MKNHSRLFRSTLLHTNVTQEFLQSYLFLCLDKNIAIPWVLGTKLSCAQDLFLVLHVGITPSRLRGTMYYDRDRTWVSCLQGKSLLSIL